MMATVHVASGIALGALLLRPGVALAGGLASHLLLDAIPHGRVATDHESYLAVARIDGIAALTLLVAALVTVPARWRAPVALGALGAIALDADKPAMHFFGIDLWPAWLNAVHHGVQREHPALLVVDAAVLAASLSVAYFLAARGRRLPSGVVPSHGFTEGQGAIEDASAAIETGRSVGSALRSPNAQADRSPRPNST